jgi:hypothetical protein
MDLSDYLKNPLYAAIIGAIITALYIYSKARLNKEDDPTNAQMMKPAALNAILVYFIVSGGVGAKETISTEPF